jgi:hypothetical protein
MIILMSLAYKKKVFELQENKKRLLQKKQIELNEIQSEIDKELYLK